MPHCFECGKKETVRRAFDPTSKTCLECALKVNGMNSGTNLNNGINPEDNRGDLHQKLSNDIDKESSLGNIPFKQFKEWFHSAVSEEITKAIDPLKKDIKAIRGELVAATKDISDNSRKITLIETEVNRIDVEANNKQIVIENNLKYLINHDRNMRRHNVVVMGVSEDGLSLEINNKTANTDEEKIDLILAFINPGINVGIKESFRLGVKVDGKCRPIKIIFDNKDMASCVLGCSCKLKELPNVKVYVKPDKTKSERMEYERLWKRKTEAEAQFPLNNVGDPPRVVLSKGSLLVDGNKIDAYKSPQSLF